MIFSPLRLLTPPMETPDPPSDTPRASKQVVLTPHDIPRILRVFHFLISFPIIFPTIHSFLLVQGAKIKP